MQKISTADLRQKEIINLCDGSRLGYACDFEFDICDGHIQALIVPRNNGFFGLGKGCDLIIPWCRIDCIGEDTILVKVPKEEYEAWDDKCRDRSCDRKKDRRK